MAVKEQKIARAAAPAELPKGWRVVRFDEMAQLVNDRVDDPSEAGVERYIGLEHLDPKSLKIRRWGSPDDVEAQKLRFQPGDIIFGKRRAYQRKLAVADFEGICSAHAMVLRAREETVIKDFLPFLMQSSSFFKRAVDISVGSLSPTINWKTLASQPFAIPPKKEQRRIADILVAADEALDQIERCVTQSEQLRRNILHRIVMRGLSNAEFKRTELGELPADWDVMRIGEAGLVQLGRQRAPQYLTGSHPRPYLRVANVYDGYLDLSDVQEMDFDEQDYKKYALQPGDILLNEGQSRELVGRSCIYNGEIEGCCFQKTLLRFQPSAKVLSEYAQGYFQDAFYRGVFAEIAVQSTSMAHLTAVRFERLMMPIPPLDEQKRIARILSSINHSCNELRNHRTVVKDVKDTLLDTMLGNIGSGEANVQ